MEPQPMIRTRNYLNLAHQTSEDELEHLELNQSPASLIDEPDEDVQDRYYNDNDNSQPGQQSSSAVLRDQVINEDQYNQSDVDKNDRINFRKPFEAHEQVRLLRDLLIVERSHNAKRASNNVQLSNYIAKLQSEYLGLQLDLAGTLETAKRSKDSLQAQIERLDETIKEKDSLIDQLQNKIKSLDEPKLRSEFEARLNQEKEVLKLESEQIEAKYEAIQKQLMTERINNSNLLQDFQTKFDDREQSHEVELGKLQDKLRHKDKELEILLNEPKNEVIKSLREDKSRLSNELESIELILSDTKSKQESLTSRVASLLEELEQTRLNHEEESDNLQAEYLDLRKSCNKYKMELLEKDENLQISEFNLDKSEKRVKSLLDTLKSKEEAYSNLVESLEARHELQMERFSQSIRNLELQLSEKTNELELKHIELSRIESKYQTTIESVKIDRDDRSDNYNDRIQKLESDLATTRARLDIGSNEIRRMEELLEKQQNDAAHFRSECDRLTLQLEKTESDLAGKERLLDELKDKLHKQQAIQNSGKHIYDNMNNLIVEESKIHTENLEKSIMILRDENERLSAKLRINETHLSQINATIAKERARLIQDYDLKLDQFKAEWKASDKSRLRYRRYGYKLKRYIEHLRQSHSHICDLNCNQAEPVSEITNDILE